jgi:uncharacterized protein YggE
VGAFPSRPPQPMIMMRQSMDAEASTPIQPGEQTLSVTVSTRWRFNPGQ